MSWVSKNLAGNFPGIYQNALRSINAIRKELAVVNNSIRDMQRIAQAAEDANSSAVSAASLFADNTGSTGIYRLSLSAGQGVWSDRIRSAYGAPPMSRHMFSAIFCTLTLTYEMETARSAMDTIKAAITSVPKITKSKLKLPSSLPSVPKAPTIPVPQPLPENEWISTTVSSLFPGPAKALSDSLDSLNKNAVGSKSALQSMQEQKQELERELRDAERLAENLAATGTYQFTAEPEREISGDWFQRLTSGSEEDGRPPYNPNLFSTGTVIVMLAPKYDDLVLAYNNIRTLMDNPLV